MTCKNHKTANSLPEWYQCIEKPVRKIVYALRNHGINTECSCGHEMYVQFLTCDPTTTLRDIYNALAGLGISDYTVAFNRDVMAGHIYEHGEIRFRKKKH